MHYFSVKKLLDQVLEAVVFELQRDIYVLCSVIAMKIEARKII